MSNVNIKRAVENIRSNTTVYTPIAEVIVNAIQAIEASGKVGGKVSIRVIRDGQVRIEGGIGDVRSFEVEDDGIGFNEPNRKSFDTLYSDHKIAEGGKGFGRFTCLKYFEDLLIDSVYETTDGLKHRKFSMGKGNDIIVNESISAASGLRRGTVVTLDVMKKGKSIEKKLTTIARNLVEKLLPYFITQNYVCPEIVISESDGVNAIRLNDFVNNELAASIREVPIETSSFVLPGVSLSQEFKVRVFKIYYTKSQKSRICLVAHKRDVSGSVLHKYIPEFTEDFYDKTPNGEADLEKNYTIRAYVFGSYLDQNVSLERGGFEFQMESDALYGISQLQIEVKTAEIARGAMGSDVLLRQEKKRERVRSYVDDEAPWHKSIFDEMDLSSMPYNPSNEEIESRLQHEKYLREVQIRQEVTKLMSEVHLDTLQESVAAVVDKISETSKNDLIHYVALRRNILDLFGKSLELDKTGSYSSEGVVHDIIFPRRHDTDQMVFEGHNLWLIDERLNFTNYVSSDLPLNGASSDRPDLLVYGRRVLFRGDNDASNPITIFEFKKPLRDDFVNPSSAEDPVQQIIRYVNGIREGKFKTPEGRKMLVADGTPCYGYVVCDLTPKVEKWLEQEKNFKPMPDRMGWFDWLENINLYIEVLSWDKVLKDAKFRNKIFFHKLDI